MYLTTWHFVRFYTDNIRESYFTEDCDPPNYLSDFSPHNSCQKPFTIKGFWHYILPVTTKIKSSLFFKKYFFDFQAYWKGTSFLCQHIWNNKRLSVYYPTTSLLNSIVLFYSERMKGEKND